MLELDSHALGVVFHTVEASSSFLSSSGAIAGHTEVDMVVVMLR